MPSSFKLLIANSLESIVYVMLSPSSASVTITRNISIPRKYEMIMNQPICNSPLLSFLGREEFIADPDVHLPNCSSRHLTVVPQA